MKFTKLTVLALILALFVCAFVACGGPAETETEANGTETEAGTNETQGETEAETEAETQGETEHVHDIEVVVTEATCTERGYSREVCKTCSEVVDITPHSRC